MALERLGLLLGLTPVSGGQCLDDGHHDGADGRYNVFHLRHIRHALRYLCCVGFQKRNGHPIAEGWECWTYSQHTNVKL